MNDSLAVTLLHLSMKLNERQKQMLMLLVEELNSEAMKDASDEETEIKIKNAFIEMKLAA